MFVDKKKKEVKFEEPTDPSLRQSLTIVRSDTGTQHSPIRHFFVTSTLNRFIV